MKDNTDYMDKAIKEKFEGHEVPVPSHLWNSIESNLPPESNNTRGNFFFKNPFILSILFISTILVGTYLYHSSNKTTNDSTNIASLTNASDNSLNSAATTDSKNTTNDPSSIKEKNQSSESVSNSTAAIDSEEKDQLSVTSSNILVEGEGASIATVSKNQKQTNTGSSKNNQHTSNTSTNSISSKTNNLSPSSNKNSSAFNESNKNSQQHTITNQSSTTKSQPDKSALSNTSSENGFAKATNANNMHSASTTSNTKSNASKSTNTTSATSAAAANTTAPTNTTAQTSNTAASKNSERTIAHTDTSIQSTSAFMQKSDSFNKIENSGTNTASEKNTLTENSKTNNTTNTTTTSATTINAADQASNTRDSENNAHTAVYADSIKQFTSAFMKESNSFNKIESGDSNTFTDKNTSADNSKTTNTTNTTTATASNQDLNAAQISSTLTALNATNTLSTPSETTSLFKQDFRANETTKTESTSINKHLVSNTHTNSTQTASTRTSPDSIHNSTPLENHSHTNSIIENNTALSANNSTKELLLKTDSTLTVQLDSTSIEKQPETIEVKSSEAEKKKKSLFLSRCSIDGYATPALGYIYLSPNSNQEGINEITKERNKNASTGFGFTTGLRANYALSQKIEIGIGFQYSSLSQQSSFTQSHIDSSFTTYQGHMQIDSTYDPILDTTIYTSHFVITDSATINSVSTNVKSYTDKFQNFSIPIHIAYGYSISNKLSLLARTSLLINYQTSSTTYLNGADSTIIGYHSNKNLSLGGSFSIGCYYQFAKRYSVFAEPIITYYFSNVFDKQVPFKQKQLMLGLQTGIRFSF